jgi:ferredoxin
LRACKAKAIYFEHSVRLVDYEKCKACLNCVQVCPRNAITVTSVVQPEQVLSIKVEHDKCTICEKCLNDEGKFCPKSLFYKDKVTIEGKEQVVIRFKYKEIAKCQGCLKCELSCPENAIKPVKFEA